MSEEEEGLLRVWDAIKRQAGMDRRRHELYRRTMEAAPGPVMTDEEVEEAMP